MLEWVRKAPPGEHRVIVCATEQQAMDLYRENQDLESWQFVGPRDIEERGGWEGVLMGRGGSIVLGIDNADWFIQHAARYWKVGAVSLTDEKED